MMAEIALRGRGEIISLYAVKKDFEIDTESYDLYSRADQEALYRKVEELVENGEIDAIMPSSQKRILFRDESVIAIDDTEYRLDDIVLKEERFEDFLNLLEERDECEIFYIQRLVGEGEFVYESEKEQLSLEDISLSYIDCNSYLERYDLVQEDTIESVCDSINIDSVDINGEELQESEGYFNPTVMIDELYIAKYNQEEGMYLLERLDVGGEKLAAAECYVDDFDKN